MKLIKINGVDISSISLPSEMKVDVADLDGETNRNAKGDLIRDRIAVKRKISLEFPPLSAEEMSQLLNLIQDVFFQVTYPDPLTGGMRTGTFYVGDRTAPALRYRNGQVYWAGLSMNFIER